ncbi:MAG TPA: type I secretion system permease/ATPase [Geminicoccaceae bacterium]|nr:type I secretion system permease/ATPase [Geminicoccaceae bacterium]
MPDQGAILARPPADPWRSAVRGLGGGLAAALLASFALNLLMLAVPLYSMQVYDRVLGSGHLETLLLLSLMAGAALAALGAFEVVRTSLLARTASRFEQILAHPLVVAAARDGGPGAAGLRDLAQLRQALAGPAMNALFDAPWLPLSLVALWFVHPILGVFAGASAIALALLALANDRLTRRPQHVAACRQRDAQAWTEAMARQPEPVLAMGMLDPLAGRVGKLHVASLVAHQAAAERGGAVMGATRALRLAVQSGAMGLGAWLVLRHELTPGAMLASSILVSKALAPVEQMVGTWRTLGGARDSWRRVRDLLAGSHEAAAAVSLPRPTGRLSVEDATVQAAGDGRPLLRGVGFELEAGECLAVVGPSGAGKSTLGRLLAGVLVPARGGVRLDGARLEHYRRDELGRHVGYLPQDAALFAGTVAENIARMDEAPSPEAVVAAAQAAEAHEVILRLPQGYATPLADRGMSLSGGQRQRLGLARALFGGPRLVVLDEPNAHLDGAGEAALMAVLARLKQARVTTVLITHRPQVLQRADKVLVLEDGMVSRFGPRDAVLPALFRPSRAA